MRFPWLVILALASSRCASPPPPPLHEEPFNLLLITLDTLRADRLGAYGYALAETPHLDALAREGALFEQAISPVPLTLPSHATIMTGMFPMGHNVRDNGTYRLSDDATTLAEILKARGYETAAFVSTFVIDSRFGLDQGFDIYFDFDEEPAATEKAKRGLAEVQRLGGDTAERAIDWLSHRTDAPFFAWVHLYDPHSPFEAPEPYRSRFPDRPYDAEVAYTDAVVGNLVEAVGDDTLIVVLGDHGESLGEHGEEYHSWFVYDATLKVPFLLRLRGVVPPGLVVEEQVRLADVAPTVLELLDVPPTESIQGRSLTSWLHGGRPESLPAYSESLVAHLQFGWGELKTLRDGGYKYIAAPRPELYDLREDPGERRNLIAENAALARELEARLRSFEDTYRRGDGSDANVVDAETMRKLQSLGYVGAGGLVASTEASSAVDPKDRIGDYRDFSATIAAALEAMDAGEPGRAMGLLEPLARKLPMHHLVHYHLGQAFSGLSDYPRAATELGLAVELAPRFAEARAELAEAWVRAGAPQLAVATLQEGLREQPDNPLFHFQLGFAHHARGELTLSLASYRRALELAPVQPRLLSNMSALYLQTGDAPRAVERLEELLRIEGEDALAWNNLGLALVQSARLEDAGPAFRRASELDPANEHFRRNLHLWEQQTQR